MQVRAQSRHSLFLFRTRTSMHRAFPNVLVGCVVVIDSSKFTGAYPGAVLRGPGYERP